MKWQTLSSEYVHENPWYKIRRDQVIRPDGTPGEYNVIETRGAAYIIAQDERGRFPLIRQYRYTTGLERYELPAGGLDADSPLDAAKRELLEETGLTASDWMQAATLQASNGTSNAISHVFKASGLTQTGTNQQAEEGIIGMKMVTYEEAFEMIRSGELSCAQCIAAITVAHLS
jgi:ADP-ribose pyrophosphatase YjhB (NUDIX family)